MKLETLIATIAVAASCCAQEFAASNGAAAESPATGGAEVADSKEVAAEEPAAPTEFVQQDGGAMAAEQQAMEEEPTTAIDALNKKMSTKYADADSASDRIVVMQKIMFDVQDPEVGTEFLKLRTSKMAELLLQAKVQIAQTIFSRMSAEQILEKPYSPVADKFKNQMKDLDSELKIAYKNLMSLGVEYNQAKLEKKANLTPSERAAVIGNWLGIANEKNLALQLDAQKKKKFDAASAQYKAAIEKFEALKAEAEAAKPQILKEMKTSMTRATQMQMHGGVVLEQAEQYDEPNEKGVCRCTMAVIYSWSEETQNAAAAVLSAKPLKLKPGKKTLREWLDSKAQSRALAQWVGPRRYIDKNGDMWFIGIAAAPVAEESAEQETNEQIAELRSAIEVGFALYADVSAKKTLEEAYRETKTNPNGPMTAEVAQSYSEKLTQGFKDLPIFGLAKVYTKEMEDEASGQKIVVIVSAVNASRAQAMKGIQAKAHKLGIDINKSLQEERGRQDRMLEQTNASKTDRNAYNAGRRQADKELREHEAQKVKRMPTIRKSDAGKGPQGGRGGRLRHNVIIHDDDDD